MRMWKQLGVVIWYISITFVWCIFRAKIEFFLQKRRRPKWFIIMTVFFMYIISLFLTLLTVGNIIELFETPYP